MKKKRTFFIGALLPLLISAASIFLESRSDDQGIRKIIPSTAFFALNRLYCEGDSNSRYRILLEFLGGKTFSAAERETFKNPLYFKNFCIADVSVYDIFRLAKRSAVRQIYVLNQSNSNGGSSYESKKTVIGVIDKGIDWKNKLFMNKDGSESRIVYLWDQNEKKIDPGNTAIPYGAEYRKCDVEASINSGCNLIPLEAGHGWIISAIAAGNGIVRDEQNNELFPGKPIDLPIIMVNTTGKMDALVDAVAYITRKAAQMKSKCVINFAYCKHVGPHDSNDMYVRAIDSLLDENSIMIVSAGNEGMKNIYVREETLPTAGLEFEIDKHRYAQETTASPLKVEIEIWSGGASIDNVSLISPQGKIYGPVRKREYSDFNSPDGLIFISNGISNFPGLDKNSVVVSIASQNEQAPQDGKWAILLESSGKSKQKTIEAWITKSEKCDTRFNTEGKTRNTISFLAFGKKVVSVGAWAYGEENSLNEADYGNNPCKNIYCRELLPTVFAAGRVNVTIPGFSEPLRQDGTSVSTALITRYIARTWDENPGLKASDIKKSLNGKVMTFSAGLRRWKGSTNYKPSQEKVIR